LKAIILSAGQGKRLLPMTADRPKCLIPIAGRTVLEWQIDAMAKSGVEEVVVITGFRADAVDAVVARLNRPSIAVRTEFNPFFAVADNIASCFVARSEMVGDFLLMNGDTLAGPAIIGGLLAGARAPVTVTIDRKPRYDDDDMKVTLDGLRLTGIGKTLPLDTVDAESIGLLMFRDSGGAMFRDGLTEVLRTPDGLKGYYLSVINGLAGTGRVEAWDIAGEVWSEIDFPADLTHAERVADAWLRKGWARHADAG
jgi:choline kinase